MTRKVAIVVGASAGIGRAYALALASEGATVVAAARSLGSPGGEDNNTLANVVKRSASLPGSIHVAACDVSDESAIAPHMIRQRSGSIINITAKAGEFVSRGERLHDGTVLYGITKAALNRLTFF